MILKRLKNLRIRRYFCQTNQRGGMTYYQILGVDPTSSVQEIKRAYSKLVKKYHPDVSNQVGSKRKFDQISEAFNHLADAEKKRKYDAKLGFSWGSNYSGFFKDQAFFDAASRLSRFCLILRSRTVRISQKIEWAGGFFGSVCRF